MNERERLIRLKNDDHEAFSWLYDTYWSQVYNFCRLYITSIEDAKEVVQQVFVKVWEARALIKEDENFKGFLFIITRNLVFNRSKKTFNENFYKMSVLSAFSESDLCTPHGIEEDIAARQLNEYLNQLIESLPLRQKEVFRLNRQSHLSYKEIAIRLNISEKTVENHLSKAMKFLKQNIKLFLVFLSC